MISGDAYVLCVSLAGWLCGRALSRGRLGALESWALGTAASLGLLTLAAFVLALVGWGLPGPLLQLALLAGGIQLARVLARPRAGQERTSSRRTSSGRESTARESTEREPTEATSPRWPWLVVLPSLALAVLMAGDWGQREPAGNWDGMANWTTQARHLARSAGDPGEGLRARVVGHADYPLMLPLAIALGWQWTGDETQHVPRLLAVLFVLLLAAASLGSFARVAGSRSACFASAALLAAPALQLAARGQIADLPLAVLTLLAGTRLVASLQASARGDADPLPATLTGFLIGLLPWMKNEGMLLALCLALAALPAVIGRLKSHAPLLGRLLLGALLPLALVRHFKHAWAPPDRMLEQLKPAMRNFVPDPERWRIALDGVAREFVPLEFGYGLQGLLQGPWIERWGGLGALCLVALLLGVLRRPRAAQGVPLLATFGWLAALCLVYVLTIADDPQWHVDTSLWRLLLQMLPFTLFGALAAWSREAPPVMLRDSIRPPDNTSPEAP
ncbi:MAG: hypothetical protein DHS20C15_23400 [Planctomycetota bacterium]|nr:MAG: hypothetical protein DHS20C15_23400 [Planctomycetota bacterium]